MHRISRLAALACLALVVTAGLAIAAIQEGKFTGPSDDDEPVLVKVNKTDDGKFVTKFKVDQGKKCGVTKYTKRSDPDIMPAKIKDRKFRIVDKLENLDVVVFKVKGEFQTQAGDVIAGKYSQVACDGETDTYVVNHVKA